MPPLEDNKAGESCERKREMKGPRKIWRKAKNAVAAAGFDKATVRTMVKGALPSTIALAIYRLDSYAKVYDTQGFLVSVIALLGFAFVPRAQFLQLIILSTIATCVATAICTLAIWTALAARSQHTEPYDGYASAVCGAWLFIQTWAANSLRSAYQPQSQVPTVLYSIFANICMIYGPTFLTTEQLFEFIVKILRSFLTSYAIAAFVNLFVLPSTSRETVFEDIKNYVESIRSVWKRNIDYFDTMKTADMFTASKEEHEPLRAALQNMMRIHAKLTGDLQIAKEEIAYGKLRPSDMSKIGRCLRHIFVPLTGISSMIQIFERIARDNGWDGEMYNQKEKDKVVKEWHSIFSTLHSEFQSAYSTVDSGLEHVLIGLELKKPTPQDEEQSPVPGSTLFAQYLQQSASRLRESRNVAVKTWCSLKELHIDQKHRSGVGMHHDLEDQRQLYLVLFIHNLLCSATDAAVDLVSLVDEKLSSGFKRELIVPGYRRVKKRILRTFISSDVTNQVSYGTLYTAQPVYYSDMRPATKDPEHLPPANNWEKFGNLLSATTNLLRSSHSGFGFRVACATISIALISYFPASFEFFINYRLVWAMNMGTASFTRTTGLSAANFLHRTLGSFLGAVASYPIYYIVVGKVAGVIVLLFIWMAFCFFAMAKKPSWVLSCVLAAVTPILTCGYALQVDKIGIPEAESNGQLYYPVYLLAPFRFLAVAGGLAFVFIWEVFPYPISDRSETRQALASSLYLLGNHYALVYESVNTNISQGQPVKLARIKKTCDQIISKELSLLAQLRNGVRFTKWEVVGGKFPVHVYTRITNTSEKVLLNAALIEHFSQDLQLHQDTASEWQELFRKSLQDLSMMSQEVTNRICLLASCVTSGHMLPPHMPRLQPYEVTHALHDIDEQILHVRHATEQGYAAFAVMEIASRAVVDEVNELTELIKDLVGELDYSYQDEDDDDNSNNEYHDGFD